MSHSSEVRRGIALISLHSCPLGNLGARDTGGMSVYIREIARHFDSLGFDVDIFTRGHDSHTSHIMRLAEGVRLIHLKVGETRDVIDKLALYSHIDSFNHKVNQFAADNDMKYRHVFSHYWLSGVSGQILAEKWQVPHSVMFHTLGAVKNQIGRGVTESELRVQEERNVIKACDQIIASTSQEKELLCRLYDADADKIRVVPCGVNLEMFQPSCHEEQEYTSGRTILFVGRLDPFKGINLLIDALSLIKEDDRWRCLLIGGDGDCDRKSFLLRQAVDRGVDDRLEFVGPVPQEELKKYYSMASVLVVPSYYESFGLVALEAMACGCPVIAGDVGDLKNIINPGLNGDILKNWDARELADKIGDWINCKPRTHLEEKTIRQTVVNFSWQNVTNLLKKGFDELSCIKAGTS